MERLILRAVINDTFETSITWERYEQFHDAIKAATGCLGFRVCLDPPSYFIVKNHLVEMLNSRVERELSPTDQRCQEVLVQGNRSWPRIRIRPAGGATGIGLGLTVSELFARSLDFDMEGKAPAVRAAQDEKNVCFYPCSDAASTF